MQGRFRNVVWLGLLAALALLSGPAHAQWVDTTFYVPDSMTGLSSPSYLARNPLTHTLYVGGEEDAVVFAVDEHTGRKLARIPVAEPVYGLACDEAANLVYCVLDEESVSIIDGVSNQVVGGIVTAYGSYAVFANAWTTRAYCATDDGLVIADGRTGQIVRTMPYSAYSFALNPVERKLYVVSDGCILVFDGATDSLIKLLPLWVDEVAPVYSTVSHHVYCAYLDSIAIIDGRTDSAVGVLGFPAYQSVNSFAVSGDGSTVYGSDDLGYLMAIDCTRDAFSWLCQFGENPEWLWCSPVTGRIYCLDASLEQVLVADDASGEVLSAIPVAGSYDVALLGNPEDNLLYCPSPDNGLVYFIDGNTDSVCLTSVLVGEPSDLCLNSRLNCIYIPDYYSGDVTVVDCETNQLVATVPGTGGTSHLVYSPHTRKVFCARPMVDLVTVFSESTNHVVADIPVVGDLRALVYNSLNRRVYGAGYSKNTVVVIDGDSDKVRARIAVPRRPTALCFNPVANKIYSANYGDSSVSVIDCKQDRVIARVQVGREPYALAWDATGNKVYCASRKRNKVYVISGATDSLVAVIPVGSYPLALACAPNTGRVYCCNARDNSVSVIDTRADVVIATIPVGAYPNYAFCNPKSGIVYCSNHAGSSVTSILGADDQVLRTITVQEGPRTIVASADGDRVYVANEIRSSVSALTDAGSVTPVTGIGGGTVFGRDMTLLSTEPALIFDINGRKIGSILPGTNSISQFPCGVYFVRIGTHRSTTRKVIIAR